MPPESSRPATTGAPLRRRAPGARQTSAFTLIELLSVIAIIGILAAILIPVVGRVRSSARNTTSISQMRQISLAALVFAQDNKDKLPWKTNEGAWSLEAFGKGCLSEYFISGVQMEPYLKWESPVWYDPLALEAAGVTFDEIPSLPSGGWLGRVRCNPAYTEADPLWFYSKQKPVKLSSVARPSGALLFFVSDASDSAVGTSANPPFKDDYATCGFADGSARRVKIPAGEPLYIRDFYCRSSTSATMNNAPSGTLVGFDY